MVAEVYVCSVSFKETPKIYMKKSLNNSIPAKRSIHELLRKWRTTRSVSNSKRNRQSSDRTSEAMTDIQKGISDGAKKSINKLLQQTDVKYISNQKIFHDLNLIPYRANDRATT